MPTQLKIFDCYPATRSPSGQLVTKPARLRETVTLVQDGEAARAAARTYLNSAGAKLRSLNWAPDPGKPDMLVAYTERTA